MEQTARIATTAHIRNINRATLSLACFDFLLPFKEPFAVTLTAAGVLSESIFTGLLWED